MSLRRNTPSTLPRTAVSRLPASPPPMSRDWLNPSTRSLVRRGQVKDGAEDGNLMPNTLRENLESMGETENIDALFVGKDQESRVEI